MIIDQSKFAYATGRIRALETRLISQSEIERMIGSESARGAFAILRELSYGNNISEDMRETDFQNVLWTDMASTKSMLKNMTPHSWFLNIIWHGYDVHNAKLMIKARHAGKKLEEIEGILIKLGAIDTCRLAAFIFDDETSTNFGLTEEDEITFKAGLQKASKRLFDEGDTAEADFYLDRLYFSLALTLAKRIKSYLVLEYVKQSIDFANIDAFLRINYTGHEKRRIDDIFFDGGHLPRKFFEEQIDNSMEDVARNLGRYPAYASMLMEGNEHFEKEGSFLWFEKAIDDRKLNLTLDAKKFAYGAEVVFAYLLAKENNAKVVRMIMTGKINGLDDELIRKSLRNLYTWNTR